MTRNESCGVCKNGTRRPVEDCPWCQGTGRGGWALFRWTALLNRKLVDLAARRIKRLIVEVPVRSGKSELGTKYNAAWYLGTFPDDRVIMTGHNSSFAEYWGGKVRDLTEEHGPRLFGVQVSQSSGAKADWELAKPHRGGMVAVGVGTPPTGRGGNLVIVDDPIKPLAADCPIPTPQGWKLMGELEVGDEVFDQAGQPCRVVNVTSRWRAPRNRVWFSDGSYVDAHPRHLWRAFNRSDQAVFTHTAKEYEPDWWSWQSKGEARARQVTTEQIAQSLTARGTMRNWTIPNTLPLELPTAELPIDPYVLGYWLGDGTSSNANITVHRDDRAELVEAVEQAGYVLRNEWWNPTGTTVCLSISTTMRPGGRYVDCLTTHLRTLGVLSNKHVPAQYLRASREQRLALLRGLMDSDGGIGNGQVVFCSTERRLADAVMELLVSLGSRATLRSRPAADKTAYLVSASPPFQPFQLERKAKAWHPAGQIRRRNRTIVNVEVLEETEHLCITVDSPSHLFLAGHGMVPTCNSSAEAYSLTYRENLWTWWSDIRSRFEPEAVCVIIMSRWHEDDLVGRLIKRQEEGGWDSNDEIDEWEILHLPALAEPTEEHPDPLGRAPGEALCPERYTRNQLLAARDGPDGVGPIAFAAQYQNAPTSPEGDLFPTWSWRYCDAPPAGLRWVRHWDLAATSSDQGKSDPDWTAGVLMAKDPTSGLTFVADVRRIRQEGVEVERFIRGTAVEDMERYGTRRQRMPQDPGQAGKALVSHYSRNVLYGFEFESTQESGDKYTRALPFAGQVQAENVVLVRGDWNTMYVEECRVFSPRAAHDDMVDASSMAFQEIAGLNRRRARLLK